VRIVPDPLILPEKTLSGAGKVVALMPECARFGRRGVLVHGRALDDAGLREHLLAETPHGASVLPWRHAGGEPTLAQVAELLAAARRHGAEWIAAVGGGSVLDLGKAAAGLFRAGHAPVHYHDGGALEADGIPFAAVPTTAGTGAEATVNAVLTNEATGSKKSIRDPRLMARLVILDPALLAGCPRAVLAASGMDAFTQAMESFTSRHAGWLSDQLALKGLELVARNLEAVHSDPAEPGAADLLLGSYLAGLALSMARLGVVHGVAHPLGSIYHVPHGLVCAVCLPHAVELNREAFGAKYTAMSTAVGGDLLARTRALLDALGIASPFAGQPLREREAILRETLASGSTAANPKPIAGEDVEWLLARLFG
jgi:alcohol dehydrogenase class IV